MAKELINKVDSGFLGRLDDFNELQPNGIKATDYSLITKESIKARGFVQPFAMCKLDGKLFILDGHLRKDLINELKNEGHKVPELFSYYLVDVGNNRKKAVDILISFNTKQNKFKYEELVEYCNIEEVTLNVTEVNVVIEDTEEDQEHEKTVQEITNMIAVSLTDEEAEIWLKIKEELGKKKDKNAIFELVKFYSQKNI